MKLLIKLGFAIVAVGAPFIVSACGGSESLETPASATPSASATTTATPTATTSTAPPTPTTTPTPTPTSAFAVGGTVSGLLDGSLVLQDNAGDDLTVTASGAFAFATALSSGASYAVTITQQPDGQACTLAAATGAVGASAVSTVLVNCAPNSYAVGGTVTGLSGTLVIQNNAGDDLTISADGAFAFATPIAHDAAYAVTALAQPSNPNQVCTLTNASGNVGSSDVAEVAISCSTVAYAVSVSVSGLTGGGLILQDNGADDLAIDADGDYAFAIPVTDGQVYSVAVSVQPSNPDQVCTVTDGTSTIAGADVSGIIVTCQ